MLYPLRDADTFRKSNLSNWLTNTDYWLGSELRHLKEIRAVAIAELSPLMPAGAKVADVGCGSAWVLELVAEIRNDFEYTGFDFNPKFVESLSQQHKEDVRARFILGDAETGFPAEYLGGFDVVVNAFNFFELPDLSRAFRNAVGLLRPGGSLIVITIDPTMQLLAISDSWQSFLTNLSTYGESKELLAYDKPIDTAEGPSTERVYRGVLYSFEDFASSAESAGFSLRRYREVRSLSRWPPQIYQFMVFRS